MINARPIRKTLRLDRSCRVVAAALLLVCAGCEDETAGGPDASAGHDASGSADAGPGYIVGPDDSVTVEPPRLDLTCAELDSPELECDGAPVFYLATGGRTVAAGTAEDPFGSVIEAQRACFEPGCTLRIEEGRFGLVDGGDGLALRSRRCLHVSGGWRREGSSWDRGGGETLLEAEEHLTAIGQGDGLHVRDVTIRGASVGISAAWTPDHLVTVSRVSVEDATYEGIAFSWESGGIVCDSVVTSRNGTGINLSGLDTTIDGVSVTALRGIELSRGAERILIRDADVTSQEMGVLVSGGTDLTIENSTIRTRDFAVGEMGGTGYARVLRSTLRSCFPVLVSRSPVETHIVFQLLDVDVVCERE